MCAFRAQAIANSLQGRHPRGSKVAILQYDPPSCCDRLLYQPRCLGALPLSCSSSRQLHQSAPLLQSCTVVAQQGSQSRATMIYLDSNRLLKQCSVLQEYALRRKFIALEGVMVAIAPREMACKRLSISRSEANCNSVAVGSLPADRTNTSGVVEDDSA
jgi:hypothetical protein